MHITYKRDYLIQVLKKRIRECEEEIKRFSDDVDGSTYQEIRIKHLKQARKKHMTFFERIGLAKPKITNYEINQIADESIKVEMEEVRKFRYECSHSLGPIRALKRNLAFLENIDCEDVLISDKQKELIFSRSLWG